MQRNQLLQMQCRNVGWGQGFMPVNDLTCIYPIWQLFSIERKPTFYLRCGPQTVIIVQCFDATGNRGRDNTRFIAKINTNHRHFFSLAFVSAWKNSTESHHVFVKQLTLEYRRSADRPKLLLNARTQNPDDIDNTIMAFVMNFRQERWNALEMNFWFTLND